MSIQVRSNPCCLPCLLADVFKIQSVKQQRHKWLFTPKGEKWLGTSPLHAQCVWLGSRANDCFHTTARARTPLHCTGTPPRFRSDSIGRWLIGSMLRYCTYPSDPASPIQQPFFESRKNSRALFILFFPLFFSGVCAWIGWMWETKQILTRWCGLTWFLRLDHLCMYCSVVVGVIRL